MPSVIQSAFSTGEVAPEYYGRSDLGAVYQHALRRCRNFVALPQGSVTRRPGTLYVANAQNLNDPIKLVKLIPSSGTVYVLEFGPLYIRFYRRRAVIGAPFEVVTTYAAGEIAALSFFAYQSQLWIFHPNHPPATLSWGGADQVWSLAAPQFRDGPYLAAVPGGTTITPGSAGSSAIALTASGTDGVNGGDGFGDSDVGRSIRFQVAPLGLTALGAITGGSNWHVGDIINPADDIGGGGDPLETLAGAARRAQVTVTSVATGAVNGAVISDPGMYLAKPGSFSVGYTNGSGSGFALTPTYSARNDVAIWIWGVITDVTDTTRITVDLQSSIVAADGTWQLGRFPSTAVIGNWRLGAWGGPEGYPAIAGISFQGRLVCGATANWPKRIFGSGNGKLLSELSAPLNSDFLDMAPTLVTGEVIDGNAVVYDLDDEQGDPITWISACGNAEVPQFGVGTGNAEFIVQPSTSGAALTSTNIQAYKVSEYTSAAVRPIRIGRFLLFADRGRKRLREWMYLWSAGGPIGPEADPYAKHLFKPGIAGMDYALSPHPTVWIYMQDGSLAGLTYMPEQSVSTTPKENISAAHPHSLGGSWYGGAPKVESLVCVPDEDGGDDQLWLCVSRADEAGVSKTIEVSSPYFRSQPLDQAFFVDCGKSSELNNPVATVQFGTQFFGDDGATLPARGDAVPFSFNNAVAQPADENLAVIRVNNGTFKVTEYSDSRTVETMCIDPPTTIEPQNSGNWSYTRMQTNFTGFDHLAGRTVNILADGSPSAPQVVNGGGEIQLPHPASFVTVGLGYGSILATLDLDMPAPDGTTQSKPGRDDHLYLRVFETAGGKYGPSPNNLDEIDTRRTADLMDWAPQMRGMAADLDADDDDEDGNDSDLRVAMPGGSSLHRRVYIEQTDPLPMTLLALVVKGGTYDQAPR